MADIYARLSQSRDGNLDNVEDQIAACRELAARLGLTIRHVHTDNDLSATTGVRRPGFEALLTARPPAILVRHIDRLVRRTAELERVLELGVNVHSVNSGHVDLSNPAGRATAKTVTAWSQYEGEVKAQRIRDANRRRAEAGIPWKSGKRTFGYTADGMAVVDAEAELVRGAYRDVLLGVSMRAILRRWAANGVQSTAGGTWGTRSLYDMLRRPVYAGRREYLGVDVGPSLSPVIVDMDTWQAVQLMLADPERRTTDKAGRGAFWLLSGIAVCGVGGHDNDAGVWVDGCGGRCLTGTGASVGRTLKCSRARHLERKAEPIEELVVETFLARMRRPDAARFFEKPPPDLAPWRARAGELRAQLDALAKATEVPLEFAIPRARRLREELAVVEARIVEGSQGSVLAPFAGGADPGVVWGRLDMDTRRAMLRKTLTVTLLPTAKRGRGFDGAAVRIARVPRSG